MFRIVVKVRNWQNRYLPPEKQGEEVECEALVDSGAAEFALPVELIERLRLDHLGEVRVYTADGGEHDYRVFGIAEVEVLGRVCQVRVIELPHGAEPLSSEHAIDAFVVATALEFDAAVIATGDPDEYPAARVTVSTCPRLRPMSCSVPSGSLTNGGLERPSREELFQELLQSVREGGTILRGEKKASRT